MLVDFGAGFGAGVCPNCADRTAGQKRLLRTGLWTSEPTLLGACQWWHGISICATASPQGGTAYGVVSWRAYPTGQYGAWRWHLKVTQFWNQPILFGGMRNVGCFDWEFHYQSDLFDLRDCLEPFAAGDLTLQQATPFDVITPVLTPPLCLSDPPCDAEPAHAPATVTLGVEM